MRTTFARRLNVTPKQYRQRFRGTVESRPRTDTGTGMLVAAQSASYS
jgi:hypothetical protein